MGGDKYLQFTKVSEEETELYVYGDIRKQDWIDKILDTDDETRVDAMSFTEKLAAVDTPRIVVRINSYGGSVSEGLAIYNQLKNCGKQIVTVVDGFACSAASIIYCAGEIRRQPATALLMIHNAWTYGGDGNANDFRKLADDLDKITRPSVEAYKSVASISEEKIKELMDAETWLTAEEALEYGFTSEIPREEPAQSLDNSYIYNMVKKMHAAAGERNGLVGKIKDLEQKLEAVTKDLCEAKEELQKAKTPVNSWDRFF